ncbi:MAG: P-loop NTPase [Candidatus Omnitrophica bacterium]|nr:P-loop NTPase [Candidatus Omnitrophota bacterium]
MKIALSGKGGTGKTTLSAGFATYFSQKGKRVIVIDADPDTNLQITLGIKGEITPLSEMKSLIYERTGVDTENPSLIFKMNPKVDDVPEKFFLRSGNILFGIMGTVKGAGLGCMCPENTFLKAFLRHIIFARDDVVILDMEAGIEHLGRGTVAGMDWLIVVTEPGQKSVDTALKINKLAKEVKIKNIGIIENMVRGEKEKEFLDSNLDKFQILGTIPYYEKIRESEIKGTCFWENEPSFLKDIEKIIKKMEA